MCDSTSWSLIARFAYTQLYIGNGKAISFGKKDFFEKPNPLIYKGLLDLGYDPKVLAEKTNWKADFLFGIGIASEIRRSLEFKEKLDVNLFLACCSLLDLRNCIYQFKQLTGIK